MHAVVLPFPMHGHTTPALLIAHKLASLGIQVSFVCSQFRLKQLEALGHTKAESGITFRGLCKNSPPAGLLGAEDNAHDLPDLVDWVVENDEADKDEFAELIKETRGVTCIISDMPWTGQVADELGIPRIALHTSTALELAITFHIKAMSSSGIFPTSDMEEVFHIPGISDPVPATEVVGMTVPILHDHFKKQSVGLHQAAGVLCNSFQELESEAIDAVNHNRVLNPNVVPVLAIGPLILSTDNGDIAKNKEIMSWLDKQEQGSVLYISFGSFALGTEEQIQELAMGIEASGHKFLWVIHQSSQEGLPEGFEERTKGIGVVIKSWAPQAAILSHPATGAFLSHCGWNSTMESICKGVPMLALPFYDEQRANARLVVEKLGIGFALCDFDVCFSEGANPLRRQGVAQLVRGVMRDQTLRKRVALLREVAEQAALAAGPKIKSFLEQWSRLGNESESG